MVEDVEVIVEVDLVEVMEVSLVVDVVVPAGLSLKLKLFALLSDLIFL